MNKFVTYLGIAILAFGLILTIYTVEVTYEEYDPWPAPRGRWITRTVYVCPYQTIGVIVTLIGFVTTIIGYELKANGKIDIASNDS